MAMTCGEATMRLLTRYGVTTVFGIPGVHTLDMCRGLTGGGNSGEIHHVQARNEQGAGFMAEGWARATGEVGVAVVISGPGVTNAATALGQCYADSLPMLLISAEPDSHTLGKGWGVLHEITEQKKVTEPITAFSATAHRAADVPELMARAFAVFASQRPRPVHISLPMDVQAELVEDEWLPMPLPARPRANPDLIAEAADLLKGAKRPLIIMGAGASAAGPEIANVAQTLGATVVSTTLAKGILPDDHPLHLSGGTVRAEVQAQISAADVVLAVGTELADTDCYAGHYTFTGDLIRLDIDPRKISDLFPAKIGIVGDAAPAMASLAKALEGHDGSARKAVAEGEVATLRAIPRANLMGSEKQHVRLWDLMHDIAPSDTIYSCDACQIAYTGTFAARVQGPRQWFYPAGFCSLGNALPNAIGAKMAKPNTPVVAIAGDGGFMFTMPELMVAVDQKLPLPLVIWDNGGLKQIKDEQDMRDIPQVGVEGRNPDFVALAKACHCHALRADTKDSFVQAFLSSFTADRPTVIVVPEGAAWLVE